MRRYVLLIILAILLVVIVVIPLIIAAGYMIAQLLGHWKYFATLTSLFFLACFILISLVMIHRTITMELTNTQTFTGRLGYAIGGSIHSVVLNNNGWFAIFFLMSVLSLGVAVYTQFQDPPLVDQALVAQENVYKQHLPTQRLTHLLLDWNSRTDNAPERQAIDQDLKDYQQQFPYVLLRWPWWTCALIMFIISILSIPVVLADEATAVWLRIRERHARAGGSTQASGAAFARFMDRIFNRNRPQPAPAPVGTQTQPATAQAPTPNQPTHPYSFGQLFFTEFLAELLGEVFEGLVRRAAR